MRRPCSSGHLLRASVRTCRSGSVRDRKTSSRLGRWMDTLCAGAPAASSRPSSRRPRPPSRRWPPRWCAAARRRGPGQPRGGRAGSWRRRRTAAGRPRAEARLELVRRAPGHDPAVVEHRDRVGELVRLLQVLRGEQDGDALVDQAPDRAPQLLAAARVEPGGRLVQEQQLGPLDHADGQVEPTFHATRVGPDPPVRASARSNSASSSALRPGPPRAAEMPQPGHHLEVLLPGQHVVDRGVLAGQADRALDRRPGRRAGRGRRSWPCPHPAGPGWPGSGPSWSCPPRSGRAARGRSRSRRRGRLVEHDRGCRRRTCRSPSALTVYDIH